MTRTRLPAARGPLVELVLLGSVLATPAEAQISRPGATHLDARQVVVSVFPSKLDGVLFRAKIHHKKKWHFFGTRFNPQSLSAWLESVDRTPASVPPQKPSQTPVLAGLGGKEGIVLVLPEKGDRYWLLQQLDDEPLLIRADRKFNDTLLVALRAAVPYSAVDSAAFASGLVPSLLVEPDSCGVRIIHIPAPHYPGRMMAQRIQGRVEVRYIVEADGRTDPTSIEPLWASHAEFIPAVEEALRQGRFHPALFNGKPIRRQVYQVVSFRKHGSPEMWH